jgi:hypothetical protein
MFRHGSLLSFSSPLFSMPDYAAAADATMPCRAMALMLFFCSYHAAMMRFARTAAARVLMPAPPLMPEAASLRR